MSARLAGSLRMAALAAALTLAGCSWDAVNPVAWYRNVTGASKNDSLEQNAGNDKNLAAGSQQPYPNLGEVPNAPDNATSTADRDALQNSLVADRNNAQYTDDELRAGLPVPNGGPTPPAVTNINATNEPGVGATQQQSAAQQQAAAPAESPLVSPSIPTVPQGEAPAAPPPPPNLVPKAAPSEPVKMASLPPPGARRAEAPAKPLAAIAFGADSASLSDAGRARLSEIAAMQHKDGGALRIVGHAAETGTAAEQKVKEFTLAMNRAKAVADALAAEGVPQKAIAVETVPSADGDASTEIFLEH